jgi:curved DNA-binding protein CbpA
VRPRERALSVTKQADYYQLLGVTPGSDQVVIRAAYKALMLKFHPDTNGSADANDRATQIIAAFSVIGDPQKREAYDQSRRRSRDQPNYVSLPVIRPAAPFSNGRQLRTNYGSYLYISGVVQAVIVIAVLLTASIIITLTIP